jgi:hypothetical protein
MWAEGVPSIQGTPTADKGQIVEKGLGPLWQKVHHNSGRIGPPLAV